MSTATFTGTYINDELIGPEDEKEVVIDQQMRQLAKKVIEALLFSSSEPVPLPKLREIIQPFCPIAPRHLRALLDELKEEYISQQRAFYLDEIGQGYLLRTHQEYAGYIEQLHSNARGEKLSPASTEVLAIIAFRQPITRPHIDAIRGVDSSGCVAQLLERGLIEATGKLEAPGRPTIYGTTRLFLTHFGLRDIDDLKSQTTRATTG